MSVIMLFKHIIFLGKNKHQLVSEPSPPASNDNLLNDRKTLFVIG